MIVLKDLTKTYPEGRNKRNVLNNISTEIGKGEFVAIQGRSGSGKSTLLNLIAGLDVADSGTISVSGQSIHNIDEKQRTLFRRRHIGFVFQFYNLIPTLTVAENLGFCMALNNIRDESIKKRIAELLTQTGLSGREQSYPDRLSGGEQQRVAIARAVAHLPDIVLADEPTGNLDVETENDVLDLLQKLPSEHGITMVIATHNNEVARRADRILRLHDGRLIAQ